MNSESKTFFPAAILWSSTGAGAFEFLEMIIVHMQSGNEAPKSHFCLRRGTEHDSFITKTFSDSIFFLSLSTFFVIPLSTG